MSPTTQPPHIMQCMEIWGGNQRVATNVAMAGVDVWVYSRPYGAHDPAEAADPQVPEPSGGDLHYLSSCATGRITRLIIADVSGHGSEVATVAGNLRGLMRKFSNYIDQSRFVESVNERFHELRDQSDRYSALFATAVVATYFAPTDELSICNAGHPRPLWFDSRNNRWATIEVGADRANSATPANLPLGVLDPVRYDRTLLRLAEHDLVLLFTDPLIEMRLPGGGQLGEAGLLGAVRTLDASRPDTFLDQLLHSLAARAAAAEPFDDDVTMLLLQRNTAKPRPSPALAIAALGRIIRHALRSLTGRSPDPASLPQLNARSILGAMFRRFNFASRRDPPPAA